jgi:glutamyl-tRNA reductase
MWQELSLVHKKSDSARAPLPAGYGLLWKTCLREILFLDPCESLDGELRGLDAHRFLVEICSGLHSPLFGETEVFGQFRAFRAAHEQEWDARWKELLDAVEEDVRKLRRTHLVDIGSQSYGSLARRHLPEGESVVVVGGGHLAQELLPWLEGRSVTVAVRDPGKVSFANAVSFGELAAKEAHVRDAHVRDAHWLIAAPVSNEQLLSLWETNPARTVLDFRGEAAFEAAPAARYFALRTLYAELESVKELHARKKEAALAYAEELSLRRARAVVHRPFGWEDAFA